MNWDILMGLDDFLILLNGLFKKLRINYVCKIWRMNEEIKFYGPFHFFIGKKILMCLLLMIFYVDGIKMWRN